jgi:antibiotic biosynthesis monooxygenase (ABM) superfamily enzyme
MSTPTPPGTEDGGTPPAPVRPGPPTKHQLALMIWLCVFPTLTVLNLALGDWLRTMTPVVRTFVLATIAVPIVIYGLMPQLHRVRVRLMTRNA